MGLCASDELDPIEKKKNKEKHAHSREIDKNLQADNFNDQQINKLLLLGAGESGKSTLFKQMIHIYGNGFSENERKIYGPIINNNIMGSIKMLIRQSSTFAAIESIEAKEAAEKIMNSQEKDCITEDFAALIKTVWEDKGIKATYEKRAKFQLVDSAAFFLNKVEAVSKNDYCPNKEDLLRTRVRTIGIVENEFEIEGNLFRMFDVGGQRNERKKWIHCFDSVTAVIFVAAISAYDQVLYEADNVNRMKEALSLFDEICNSKWFVETAMILFLNKRDLFREKIKKVSLRVCFPDYKGPDEYEPGISFLQEQFELVNNDREKIIYTHITCATDTGNVEAVFNIVKDIIIRRTLNAAGLC